MADSAERTEAPTPKRIADARRKGDVANSRDLSGVVVMAAGFAAIATFGGTAVFQAVTRVARASWGGVTIRPEGLHDFHVLMLFYGGEAARGFLPFAAALIVSGFLVSFVQTGPLFSSEALTFRGSRISLLQGFKRLFSQERIADLAKTPLKVGVVAAAITGVFASSIDGILSLASSAPPVAMEAIWTLGARIVGGALFGLALLAIVDLAYVQYRYTEKLKMSLKEIRDEARNRDGDPQVRSRRRQVQRELSRHRMIAEVGKADLVVTNPTHFAVALSYVQGQMAAPKVLAKGRGLIAQRIRREARRHDVPIIENPPLARLLYRVGRVGREIPESLFEAVAEVLAIVYRLDRRRAQAWGAQA